MDGRSPLFSKRNLEQLSSVSPLIREIKNKIYNIYIREGISFISLAHFVSGRAATRKYRTVNCIHPRCGNSWQLPRTVQGFSPSTFLMNEISGENPGNNPGKRNKETTSLY